MIRIRGRIGDWPIDLEIGLDAEDWSQLGSLLQASGDAVANEATASEPKVPSKRADDPFWLPALALLRQAGEISGPQFLVQLEALAGTTLAAKQLLMRLRHSAQVEVERSADALLYRWREPSSAS